MGGLGVGIFICSFLELIKYNEIIVTIIIKVLIKCKILPSRLFSECTCTRTSNNMSNKNILQHSETPSERAPWQETTTLLLVLRPLSQKPFSQLLPAKDWALSEHCKSCSDVCLKGGQSMSWM